MNDRTRTAEPLDLERLLPDAVAVALRGQSWPELLAWLQQSLPHYAAAGLGIAGRPDVQRAFALALGRALWNALPLPRNGFVPEHMPEPGRNEPCPCGSGEKYKRCCSHAPPLGGINTGLLWPYVLLALSPAERSAALAGRQVPRAAIAQFAGEQLGAGRAALAVELLAPQFEPQPRHTDETAAMMLMTLCNAYDAQRGGVKRKRRLLERVLQLPGRSPLRSDACQRLACIEMDQDRPEEAWRLFRQAQQDNPKDPALGMLEVQLLLSEGKSERARERARFHLGQLRRRGDEVDEDILQFYAELASDPGRAMSEVAMDIEGGAGRHLAEWIERVRGRPLPLYTLAEETAVDAPADLTASLCERLRQMGVRGADLERAVRDLQQQIEQMSDRGAADEDRGDAPAVAPSVLQAPQAVAGLSGAWHEVYAAGKPFSVQALPPDAGDTWEPDAEERWSEFLAAHPAAFDSLDILDDLVTAVMLHAQGEQLTLVERLALPLLERAAAIIDAVLAANPAAVLPWVQAEHRPALRALYRLAELDAARGEDARALQRFEQVLRLNPGDNHGVRYRLSVEYLRRGEDQRCLDLAARFADDTAPEIRYNEALALYRLGRARSAGAALERAHAWSPRVAGFLRPARVRRPHIDPAGVSMGGDDQAWLYRDAMRDVWAAAPGALEWLGKVVGGR
jgi:tetratricopeptide (TPR) repeat protein